MITMVENEKGTNYQESLFIIALVGLGIAILRFFIIDIYINPNIPDYMKAIIALIIVAGVVFIYLILELRKLRRELDSRCSPIKKR